MRPSLNLALQLTAVTLCVALRLTSPGWLLIIFFVFLPIATAGLVGQVVTAACVMGRRRLQPAVAAVSSATAACPVGASLLITDGGDSDSSIHRPLDVLLGVPLPGWLDGVGWLLALGWFGGVIGTVVVTLTTRPVPPRPHPAPHQPGRVLAGVPRR